MPPFPIDLGKDTISDIIRRWAEVQPEAPVFVEEDKAPLTYAGLVAVMDHVRDTLWASGLGLGDRIAIALPSGPELAAVLVGIMGAAVPFPLRPDQTEEEFARLFRDHHVKALLVDDGSTTAAIKAAEDQRIPALWVSTAEKGRAGAIKICSMGNPAEGTPRPEPELPGPNDIHMMLPTSGTTGASRIVSTPHWRRVQSMGVAAKAYQLSPKDRYLLARPLYYGGGIDGFLLSVRSGGSVAFLPDFGPEAFFRVLRDLAPTWYSAGPTVQHALHAYLLEYPEAAEGSCLRFIRAGSAALDSRIADDLERFLSAPVIETYACQEAGRIATNPLPPGQRKRGTVGLPIDCEVAIQSLEGDILATGEEGEIVVRGDRVRANFEDDHEASVADTSSFRDGWFHTGDLGFLDEDGYLTLTGRIKEMINRGGEKVSPAEVDAALAGHPEVDGAVTFPIPHPTLGEEVAAAVVQAPGAALTDQILTKYLLGRLSGFKVPRRFYFVDEIPKSDAGKVQRYRLAEALGLETEAGPVRGADLNRDPTPLEARLQRLWAKALRLPDVGLDDNFFLLGGDSLQAIELFLGIEKEMKSRQPVAALFEAGTVAEMARLIEDGVPRGCIVPIQPDGDKPPFFCVHGGRGGVIAFYNLAKRLGDGQPLYGIQSVGWDRSTPPFTRNADMVAHYVSEMRKIQPHGPYFLGGFSFGGRVAVYMANKLKAAGEEVALLALMDSTSHAGRRYLGFGQWLARIGAPPGPGRIRLALRYARFRIRRVFRALLVWGCRLVLFPLCEFYRASGRPVPLFMCRPDRFNILIGVEHKNMPPYDGDAVYFKTEIEPDSMAHPDTKDSWDRVIRGKLDVVPVPGMHAEIILDSHVGPLAEGLRRFLAKAQARVRS